MRIKDILGGIFKWPKPDLKEIRNSIKGKFSYLPRDDILPDSSFAYRSFSAYFGLK